MYSVTQQEGAAVFDQDAVLHHLRHYLPAQLPLKDFVHHNTLHAFQAQPFHQALQAATAIFGYKTYLRMDEYRALYAGGKIDDRVLERVIADQKGAADLEKWKFLLIQQQHSATAAPRIGQLRQAWKALYHINVDKITHPILFRVVSGYTDQGVSAWNFPLSEKGFLASLREMERSSLVSFFKRPRARRLLAASDCTLESLLSLVVGDASLYEQYLFDQQFAHPGWSGMVAMLEAQPQSLLDHRQISLRGFMIFELLLEIDALDHRLGEGWQPLGHALIDRPAPLFASVAATEYQESLALWQEAYECSYYDEVLSGISSVAAAARVAPHLQALFCIDDREGSFRRHVEQLDPLASTYGTPGFFNIECYFQPEQGKFYTKTCPAPVQPRYLIQEKGSHQPHHQTDIHFAKQSHGLTFGWLASQTLGFWSAMRMVFSILYPTENRAAVNSFRHADPNAELTIAHDPNHPSYDGLQIGFTVEEMADRMERLLASIGLTAGFAPLVYVIGHGASSANNTHYAGYDCGACAGRPGSVNARAAAFMLNHAQVRALLAARGIVISDNTYFVAALHDTTRDEIAFYDEAHIPTHLAAHHLTQATTFRQALQRNAVERSRRFALTDTSRPADRVHRRVKVRSVSLFEPRPELNHATNALCIVGRRELTQGLFLDRRAFMNTYDCTQDSTGKYLLYILQAAVPVCGGINLEYYFSRTDNHKLGANTKLSHNVVGLIGVANGVEGDLRTGLPSQMIELHDPIRLLMIVEHYDPNVVLRVLQSSPATYEWVANGWVNLVVVLPDSRAFFRYHNGAMKPYTPIAMPIDKVANVDDLIGKYGEANIPVHLIQTQ